MEDKHLKLEVVDSTLREDAILLEPIRRTGKAFYLTFFILAAVILWAAFAYLFQYRNGLGVTGLGSLFY